MSFSNMCSWSFMFGTSFAVVDGWLLIKYRMDGMPFYMMPFGKGDLRKPLEMLDEDARSEGSMLRMLGVCADMIPVLQDLMPERFTFSTNRNYADYLYLRTELADLAGRKFQAKRNHVNKFMRTYSYEYVPITAGHVAECLELEAKWCETNDCDSREGAACERRALTFALQNFDQLGLTGGMLYADGQIAAFTFGMPISEDTFGVQVEKADTGIDGAYAMINREFAARIPGQYTYINREEDLGIEGLRKAKLSYHPTIILDKYEARMKNG